MSNLYKDKIDMLKNELKDKRKENEVISRE
jgi:hypothetical protein